MSDNQRIQRAILSRKLLVAAAVLLPAVAQGRPMSFSEAVNAAAVNAPSIAARSAQTEAAHSAAIASDRLPDPQLEVGVRDYPVTGSNAGSFTRDDFTMAVVGISQEFPNPAKRRARLGRAQAEIGSAQASEAVEARNVKIETAMAWIDLHFAERRLAALKDLDESINDLDATVAARLTSGSSRPAEALQPKQLRAEVGDRRAELIAQAEKARTALARWTGDPDPDVSGDPPNWAVDASALQSNIDALPSLRARDAATAQAEAEVRLAQADKRPDWEVGASYGYRANFGDLVSVGVKVDLPFFTKRRQEPLIAARAKEADAARLEREAAERELRAALQAAVADHAMHHDRFMRAREVLVPLARQRADLDRAGYAAGTVTLGTALGTAVSLAEAELDALDREIAVARDAIRINLTYGRDH
jgi:cobalt-zinc-cadmium efflux system outer membrane protein